MFLTISVSESKKEEKSLSVDVLERLLFADLKIDDSHSLNYTILQSMNSIPSSIYILDTFKGDVLLESMGYCVVGYIEIA